MKPEGTSSAQPDENKAAEISGLLTSSSEEALRSLIEDPAFDEAHVCLLLERKDLSASFLELVAKQKKWQSEYRVRLALAAHPHTPRLIAMRLLRNLHLMDLVRLSLLPSSPMDLRRLAEERVLGQLAQLPLGQKLMLARRGSARISAGLIAEGQEQVARVALNNGFLTEAQLLKALSNGKLSQRVVSAVAHHDKWSKLITVRTALLRHPNLAAEHVAELAADLPRRATEELLELTALSPLVREKLQKAIREINDGE